MLPTVGLYLPESLYPNHPETSDRPTTPRAKRRSVDQRSFVRTSIDPGSIVRRSAEDVSNAFTSLTTVFRFVDFVASLKEVESDVGVFVSIIQHVRDDVSLASQLRTNPVVDDWCESWPDKKDWIDRVLLDIQLALNDIGEYVENVRMSGDEGGVVKMKPKFEWVLSHHRKLSSRQESLKICHQSLMAAITMMSSVERASTFEGYEAEGMIPIIYEAPARPLQRGEQRSILRSPYARQPWRHSQKNISVPSILVSEPNESKEDVTSVDSAHSTPAELVGSTPDDRPAEGNIDLYISPRPWHFFDQGAPLPTVNEHERIESPTDSEEEPTTVSKSNTIPVVPTLAKRQQAKRIQIKKPLIKHRSLPAQLPYLPHHPSLSSELSHWILPNAQRGSIDSTDSFFSQDTDTPSTSVTSSPVMPASAVSYTDKVAMFEAAPTVASTPNLQNLPPLPASPPPEAGSPTTAKESIPATPSRSSSAETTIPKSTEQDVQESPLKPTPTQPLPMQAGASNKDLEASPVSAFNAEEIEATSTRLTERPKASLEQISTPPPAEDDSKSKPRELTSPILDTAEPPPQTKATEPTVLEGAQERPEPQQTLPESQPDVPLRPAPPPPSPPPTISTTSLTQENTRPMTSHEKRRRAHARRMQAAYDSD